VGGWNHGGGGCRCLAKDSPRRERSLCDHVTQRDDPACFISSTGCKAQPPPANSCKEFVHLDSLVYASALSTPSSTPANYHLSRATSLRNQFLRRVAPRPEFQNFSRIPSFHPFLSPLRTSVPEPSAPTNRAT